MIWQKAFGNPGIQARYIQAFEYMFVFSNGSPSVFQPIKDRKNVVSARLSAGTTVRGVHDKDEVKVLNRPLSKNGDAIGYRTGRSGIQVAGGHNGDVVAPRSEKPDVALAKDHIRTWT